MEALPTRAGIRRNHTDYGFSFGDRLTPLWEFLKKNTGRPWDEVYSEICQCADNRSIRGYHLREHVQDYVTGSGGQEHLSRYYSRSGPFYVDDDGILCFEDYRRYRYRKPAPDPDKCQVGDRLFERINGCWFEVTYETQDKSRKVWSWYQQRHIVEYYSDEVKVHQKQLSRRELRNFGLSNSPDFKWWEA